MQIKHIIASTHNTIWDKDGELVLAAQKERTAFQLIYDQWSVRIYQYFYFRTNDSASAEDLTSQLFLSALQALPRYQHRGHFAAWLFAIARNLSKAYFRKSKREVPLDAAYELPSSSNPSEEITHLDEITRLRHLVLSLTEEEQELIRLRYVAELPFADMAIVLKKREDTVKKSLYRLQARLQSALLEGNLLEENHA
jgi:RNA polymerase sigma-70 factor (ECF subfamily)